MILDGVMAQERDALMSEYLFPEGFGKGTQVPPYCAVPDFEVLKRTPSHLRARYPIQIEELGQNPSTKRLGYAFVQICPGLKYKFLWVHVDNENYRDDYLRFLRDYHHLALADLPGSYHVDHLFNRERARALRLPFIRMILLPGSINMSHGAGYEKSRTQGGIGTPGNQRGIDEIVLMKLWGVASPRKNMPVSPEIRGHLQRMSVIFGITYSELERNVQELMEVASFRPMG
jgi:hypothetical protein